MGAVAYCCTHRKPAFQEKFTLVKQDTPPPDYVELAPTSHPPGLLPEHLNVHEEQAAMEFVNFADYSVFREPAAHHRLGGARAGGFRGGATLRLHGRIHPGGQPLRRALSLQ